MALLDAYARDAMGGGAALPDDARARLGPDLHLRVERGAAVVLLARCEGEPVGVAVCFVGYSTFRARPLLNLHDLAVLPLRRRRRRPRAARGGRGAGARARLLQGHARGARGQRARHRLYAHVGFADSAPAGARTRTLFLEKSLLAGSLLLSAALSLVLGAAPAAAQLLAERITPRTPHASSSAGPTRTAGSATSRSRTARSAR